MRRQRSRRGLEWRGQSCEMEMAVANHYEELIERGRVAAAVDARTGGRCYYPGCNDSIISYPHAIPIWEGGVHDPVNRVGVCGVHRTSAKRRERGSSADVEFRERSQRWLMEWYAERGLTPDRWRAMAAGRIKSPGVAG